MEKITLKKYESIDELILASYQDYENPLTIEDMKGCEVVGLDQHEQEVKISYDQQKEGIEKQGHWGWIDKQKVIHYWIGKDLTLKALIHFFAHEIGHRTGTENEDDFQEEMRAEGYGDAATLAYEFALKVKYSNCFKN
jgi:hypothetical protein